MVQLQGEAWQLPLQQYCPEAQLELLVQPPQGESWQLPLQQYCPEAQLELLVQPPQGESWQLPLQQCPEPQPFTQQPEERRLHPVQVVEVAGVAHVPLQQTFPNPQEAPSALGTQNPDEFLCLHTSVQGVSSHGVIRIQPEQSEK